MTVSKSAKARGWCSVCERDIVLTKDGRLRHHGGPVGSGMWSDYRSYACKGVGDWPTQKPEATS